MKAMISIFKQRFYLVVLSVMLLSVLAAKSLPITTSAHILALSVFSKDLILAMIPFIIFSCAYQCMYKLQKYGVLLLVLMLVMMAGSNFISSWIGYFIAKVSLNSIGLPNISGGEQGLSAAWTWYVPKIIKNEVALILGLILGLSGRFIFKERGSAQLNQLCMRLSQVLMDYFLLPILPVFMAGFIIKMVVDGRLQIIAQECGIFALLLFLTYAIYLSVLYLLAHGGKPMPALRAMGRVLPATWVGFSTMSSMAALPLNLKAAKENTKNDDVVSGVLPISTNVHLVGDGIGIPLMALLLMVSFQGAFPGAMAYAYFALMLVLAKFSVAAVPGGGIIVLLPVLQGVFGFSPQMTALITMMYILLDPIITATNVFGNGLFVIVMDKVWRRVQPHPSSQPVIVSSKFEA